MKTPSPIEIEGTNGALPIRCFTGQSLLPDDTALPPLRRLAAARGLDEYVVVLPDVHYKPRNPTPTGTTVVSESRLMPRAIDGGVSCGMRAMSLPVPAEAFSDAVLDELFEELMRAIPLKYHDQAVLDEDESERLLLGGLDAVVDPLGLSQEELGRIENGGRILPHLDPDTIRDGVGVDDLRKAIEKGHHTLGTIGGGNHFLELQTVAELFDGDAAAAFGLSTGHTVFMLHSDSRRLGKKLLKRVLEDARDAYDTDDSAGLWTVPAESALGRRYLACLAAASHAGFANRAAVGQILGRTLRKVFGDSSLEPRLVFDCVHESIQRESHGGRELWVHRHGASRALPPGRLEADPAVAELGQPVPVPGNMGGESYLALTGVGATETFHSVAHGAGRVVEKDDAAERYDALEVAEAMSDRGIRLYRYGSDNIAGQAPQSFKSVNAVVDAMRSYDLIRPLARLHPRAVLKG